MKKSIFVLLCLTFLTSGIMKSEVCYGIRGEGSDLIISVTSSEDYLANPANRWISMLFTISWSDILGTDIIESAEALNGFPLVLDGSSNVEDSQTGMIYRKVVLNSSGYNHPISNGETIDIFKITVSHPTITTGDFNFEAIPPSSIKNGNGAFLNVFGNEFAASTCNTTASAVTLLVGLSEFKTSTSKVFFFPNPAQDKINLKIETEGVENGTLEISDQRGKIIMRQEFATNSGLTSLPLSVEKLASGMYFTKVVLHGHTFNNRIVLNN